jgi:aminoglycoside 3-N-acetyltransferase
MLSETEYASQNSNKPMFIHSGISLTPSDFKNALLRIGIKKGDVLLVHSDITVFGKLVLTNRKALLDSLVNILQDAVGKEGTILMPTFTYSFCNKETYDLQSSRSTVGVLTEHFRAMSEVSRTSHPLFSFAVWGSNKDFFLDIDMDSFGKKSVFAKLHEKKGKILMFGSKLLPSSTFLHYVEQTYGVPYRYMKSFPGTIVDNGKKYDAEATYFVRYLDSDVEHDTAKLEKHLRSNHLIKESRVGAGIIGIIDAELMYKEAWALLDKDKFALLKNRPNLTQATQSGAHSK